jgi:hypothetical protein
LKGRIDSVDKVQELKDQENQIDRTGWVGHGRQAPSESIIYAENGANVKFLTIFFPTFLGYTKVQLDIGVGN